MQWLVAVNLAVCSNLNCDELEGSNTSWLDEPRSSMSVHTVLRVVLYSAAAATAVAAGLKPMTS